ncbi:hypothetical protein [Kosakonia cowanii]|uniref:hypothetical protein n=1 Tax=Kosakonia cowanii TaxID=208223 RepID=UPI0028997CF8|nr:hypothetical protein [Kosakonia cowanii]
MTNREEVMSMRLVTASTTKAISHEDKTMNAMNAAIFLDLNCKTSQEKRLMLDSLLEMGQIKQSVYRILSKNIK